MTTKKSKSSPPTTVVSTRIDSKTRKVLLKMGKKQAHKNISFTVGEAIKLYINRENA